MSTHDQAVSPEGPHDPRPEVEAFHDHMLQRMLDKQQNARRMHEARQRYEALFPKETLQQEAQSKTTNDMSILHDHRNQQMLLEQQNKKRHLMVRQYTDSGMEKPRTEAKSETISDVNESTPHDYSLQLMLLEKQNERRKLPTTQEQEDSLASETSQDKAQSQVNKRALQDFHMQQRLLEQQNKKRMLLASREKEPRISETWRQEAQPEITWIGDVDAQARQDYKLQLMLLEQQNKKRMLLASREKEPRISETWRQEAQPEITWIGDVDAQARQDYKLQLMLLEQQNKKRMLLASREKEPRISETWRQEAQPEITWIGDVDAQARQDYKLQLMLLEQQNKRRLLMQEQESRLNETPRKEAQPGITWIGDVDAQARQDYKLQLMLLEQQNKRRLLLAREEQDSPMKKTPRKEARSSTTSNVQPPSDYQLQLMLLEQQNKKRALMMHTGDKKAQSETTGADTPATTAPVGVSTAKPIPKGKPRCFAQFDEKIISPAALERFGIAYERDTDEPNKLMILEDVSSDMLIALLENTKRSGLPDKTPLVAEGVDSCAAGSSGPSSMAPGESGSGYSSETLEDEWVSI